MINVLLVPTFMFMDKEKVITEKVQYIKIILCYICVIYNIYYNILILKLSIYYIIINILYIYI